MCVQSEQQRELTQIQYLAWPDHGVPDDSTDFLDFVALVRTKRAGQDQPMVVHCRYSCSFCELFEVANTSCLMCCLMNSSQLYFSGVFYSSAGIGRTGVLITMETALCLMECGQPVYPVDIVRTMRDQRAMMIQTPVRRHMDLSVELLPATVNHPLTYLSVSLHQSQYRFVCEAILKVYEEGLVKPLKSAIYQQREKVDEARQEEKKEQQKAGEGEETAATEDGEAAVAELLEGGLDEEDDDDEEVEVLDVGEVTEEGEDEEEEEEAEEPSVASATSVTSETSASPDPANL